MVEVAHAHARQRHKVVRPPAPVAYHSRSKRRHALLLLLCVVIQAAAHVVPVFLGVSGKRSARNHIDYLLPLCSAAVLAIHILENRSL